MKKYLLLSLTCAAGVLASAATASAQSNYEPYSFGTLAGNAGYGIADGTGSAARFNGPGGVATDSAGNVYVADTNNHTIRKVTPSGAVTTLAGLAGSSGSADGTGNAARFFYPAGVATDSAGNVYVADTFNYTIRKVTPGGVVTTLAGLAGSFGSADGRGSAARFYYPSGVATDSAGNVYVADNSNSTIRKVTPSKVVTTLAGLAGSSGSADGTGSAARFYYPRGVATDSAGNVYVADTNNHTLLKETPGGVVITLAGLAGSYGSADGTASAARFTYPTGVATDSAGNVYVADESNFTVRKVTPAGVVTTLAGRARSRGSADDAGSAARFNLPKGVATDSVGNVYVADTGNHTIRKVTPGGVVTTLAGLAGGAGSADGTGSAARFFYPAGVATDSARNVYVADGYNDTIREVTPAGAVTTLAGLANRAGRRGNAGSADGTGSAARFNLPTGVATDSAGNVYVADRGNDTIRKVAPGRVVTTLAGLAGSRGRADGTGSAARFDNPFGVATDSAGNVYVADQYNDTIRKVTPGGVVTTLAGLAGSFGSADGTGSAARFGYPTGVATDSAGNVYVADQNNFTIRKVTPAGVVTTLAGLAGIGGSADGTGSAARFYPEGVATDSVGNVYVADVGNHTIRKVTPGGVVTTLAGLAGGAGSADGTGSAARFYRPTGVATDSAGNVYVADQANHTIRAGMVEHPTQHFEAEALTVQAISPVPAGFTGTWYGVFNNVLASAGSAVAFNANAIGNFVTYTLPVAKAGTYHVLVGIQTKASKGKFQLAINGVNQGSPQDEYSPTVTYGMRDLGTVTLSSGNQAFKFYVTGKNPSSSNYNLVFDYIELAR